MPRRYVVDVIFIRRPGFYEFPGIRLVAIHSTGYYALTQSELVGPFEDPQEARRVGALVARKPLRPGVEPLPPFVKPVRIVEV